MTQRKTGVGAGPAGPAPGWRATLRRELTLWLLLKVAALMLLWGLFFAPAHRLAVTAATTSQRLALTSPAPPGASRPGGNPR